MSEFIRLQANGADAYPDASTENTYRPNGTSVENALVDLESDINTLGGVAGDAKTLAEQNSVKIATAEQEISDINSSLDIRPYMKTYSTNTDQISITLTKKSSYGMLIFGGANGNSFFGAIDIQPTGANKCHGFFNGQLREISTSNNGDVATLSGLATYGDYTVISPFKIK